MRDVIIAQIAIFTGYIWYVAAAYGVQKSISESWYISHHKFLFTLMCWGVGILQCTHSNESSLFFLSGSALCFTGTATAFRDDKMTKYVHYIGAFVAIVSSIMALFLLGIYWLIVLNTVNVLLYVFYKKKWSMWWLEIVAFYSIFGALIQYYLTKTI